MQSLNTPSKRASTTAKPDLDWSQVQETISMLVLAVAQIETTLTDGDQSVTDLAKHFTTIADNATHIGKTTQEAEDLNDEAKKQSILAASASIGENIHHTIVAFQFYDRINQRLDHVAQSLMELGQLINEPERLYNPQCWRTLQDKIKSSYTMESERIMFEHIMQGASVQEALQIYHHHFSTDESDGSDDIEFF